MDPLKYKSNLRWSNMDFVEKLTQAVDLWQHAILCKHVISIYLVKGVNYKTVLRVSGEWIETVSKFNKEPLKFAARLA